MNKDFNIKKILKFAIPCTILIIGFWAFAIFSFIASVRESVANAPLDDIINNYDRGNYTKVLTATMDELENERYKIYYDLAYEKALEGIEKNIVLENYKSAFDDSTKLRDILYADSTVTDIYNNSKSLYVDSLLSDIMSSMDKNDIESASSSLDKVLSIDPTNENALDYIFSITALKEEIAILQAEEERIAEEEAEALRLAEEERLYLEQAEADKLAVEQRIAEEAEKNAIANNVTMSLRMTEKAGSGYNNYYVTGTNIIEFKHFYGTQSTGYELAYGCYSILDIGIHNKTTNSINLSKIEIIADGIDFSTGMYVNQSPFSLVSSSHLVRNIGGSIAVDQMTLTEFDISSATATSSTGFLTFKATFTDGSVKDATVPFALTGDGDPLGPLIEDDLSTNYFVSQNSIGNVELNDGTVIGYFSESLGEFGYILGNATSSQRQYYDTTYKGDWIISFAEVTGVSADGNMTLLATDEEKSREQGLLWPMMASVSCEVDYRYTANPNSFNKGDVVLVLGRYSSFSSFLGVRTINLTDCIIVKQ